MDDPRRIRVPWHSWRWRLGLLLPMVLCALLTLNSLNEARSHPYPSILFGSFFFTFAVLFARQVWRERYPLRASGKARVCSLGLPRGDGRVVRAAADRAANPGGGRQP